VSRVLGWKHTCLALLIIAPQPHQLWMSLQTKRGASVPCPCDAMPCVDEWQVCLSTRVLRPGRTDSIQGTGHRSSTIDRGDQQAAAAESSPWNGCSLDVDDGYRLGLHRVGTLKRSLTVELMVLDDAFSASHVCRSVGALHQTPRRWHPDRSPRPRPWALSVQRALNCLFS